jgi:hypothetical protein
MGAGEINTDGVACGAAGSGATEGLEGVPGGTRGVDFSTSALAAARVVGGGSGVVATAPGVPDLDAALLTLWDAEDPAVGGAGGIRMVKELFCLPRATDPLRSFFGGGAGVGGGLKLFISKWRL